MFFSFSFFFRNQTSESSKTFQKFKFEEKRTVPNSSTRRNFATKTDPNRKFKQMPLYVI